MNTLQLADYAVFLIYFLIVASYGWWVYRKKKSKKESSKDFFLAKDSSYQAVFRWQNGTECIPGYDQYKTLGQSKKATSEF